MKSATLLRPDASEVVGAPLEELGVFDRTLLRGVALLARSRVTGITGLESIAPDRDPFILALNHNTRIEALIVPALLVLLRGGKRIHFLADWNFRMIPGVGLLYRRSGAITVPNKRARPRVLNHLKPLFTDRLPPMLQAHQLLSSGSSIGIFPEGTVNRDPVRLLRGRKGAARLSIETGAAVVPVGLRVPALPPCQLIPGGTTMEIAIGEHMHPPPATPTQCARSLDEWHARIMTEIGRLSGKVPKLDTKEASHETGGAHTDEARHDAARAQHGARRAGADLRRGEGLGRERRDPVS